MLRSAYSAFLGAFIAGAAFDTVRDRVLDTFYPAGSWATGVTVVGLSVAIAVLFVAIHACNDWAPESEQPITITGTPAGPLNAVDITGTPVDSKRWARPRIVLPEYGALG